MAMGKRITVLFAIFLLNIEPALLYAGSIPMPGMKCEGSQMADGTFIPAGQVREITHGGVRYRCVGCGSCTPISSSSSGSGTSYHTPYVPPAPSASQQIALGLMGAFFSGFFGALSKGMSDNTYNVLRQKEYVDKQKKLDEEKRKEEERKKQLLAQYNSLLAQARQQTQPQTSQGNSPFTFQTLGSQLTAFQWQSPSLNSNKKEEKDKTSSEKILTFSDLNQIFGNILQDKLIEEMDEKIEEAGAKIIEKINKKYGKEGAIKFYEKGLPIAKIAVTAKTEGMAQAGSEVIDFGISLIPMPSVVSGLADIGRKIYTRVSFTALDKFLTEAEKACEFFGLNCSKEEFWQKAESEMNMGQKIIYKWLGGRGE